MNRLQILLLLLSMPLWLGLGLALWQRNPYLIVLPCAIAIIGGLIATGLIAYAAELRTYDDWDLVIRSVLHRLGVAVAPPKSLGADIDLELHDHAHETSQPPSSGDKP